MRRWPASAAIAVAVHALALAGVASVLVDRDTVSSVDPPLPPPAPLPEARIEVALFDESPATTRGESPTRPPTPTPAAVAVAGAPRAEAPTDTLRVGPDPEPRRSLFTVRDGADTQLHVLPDVPQLPEGPAPATTPAPRSAPASPDSGALDPTATHDAFSMRVDPDGTAHLHDARNLRFVLRLPSRKDVSDRLATWHAALDEEPRGHDDDDEPAHHDREDAPRPIEHPIGSIGVTILEFDATDWLMRAHGQDPYASAKLNQLDATREERAQIGAQHRRVELGHAGELMQHNLDALWTAERDPAARKQALFELWDECSETGSGDLVEAGTRARARVVAFIRDRLPTSSTDAFTAAELAAVNAHRQSTAPFAPY